MEIAVLSYHGWDIHPDRLIADVRALRNAGWRDLSLGDLHRALQGAKSSGRLFHITIDDGAVQDAECVAALRSLSSPVTLFVSLDAMNAHDRCAYDTLAAQPDVAIEDHSLRHCRTFHYRRVIGFHDPARPLMTSPERLGLQPGDPVCSYGGELARPSFTPDLRAIDMCRWTMGGLRDCSVDVREATLAQALRRSGLAFTRFGKLCVSGGYESADAFRSRVRRYLRDGRDALARFTGRRPQAFAHPWWQPSAIADACLADLGYVMTFSGRGVCRQRTTFAVPRLFVSDETPRPLDLRQLELHERRAAGSSWMRDMGRRAVFA